MGQGLYRMLAYGTMDVPRELVNEDLNNWKQIEDTAPKKVRDGYSWATINTSYEAEPPYIGIPLAVDVGLLQEW